MVSGRTSPWSPRSNGTTVVGGLGPYCLAPTCPPACLLTLAPPAPAQTAELHFPASLALGIATGVSSGYEAWAGVMPLTPQFSKQGPRSTALTSPGSLLEMQILIPHSMPPSSEPALTRSPGVKV